MFWKKSPERIKEIKKEKLNKLEIKRDFLTKNAFSLYLNSYCLDENNIIYIFKYIDIDTDLMNLIFCFQKNTTKEGYVNYFAGRNSPSSILNKIKSDRERWVKFRDQLKYFDLEIKSTVEIEKGKNKR